MAHLLKEQGWLQGALREAQTSHQILWGIRVF
jgi:hypothetical protein